VHGDSILLWQIFGNQQRIQPPVLTAPTTPPQRVSSMTDLLSKAAEALHLADSSTGTSSIAHDSPGPFAGKEKVFVDEANGSDETGSGTTSTPYKSSVQASLKHGGLDKISIMVKKDAESEYVEITKSALKKLQKTLDGIRRKEAKAASVVSSTTTTKEAVEPEIVEDQSLPKAEKIKIRQAGTKRGTRVVVSGWVASVRAQSRKLVFVDLRDGSDLYLQCVLTGNLVYCLILLR